jgi:hypothetical protein
MNYSEMRDARGLFKNESFQIWELENVIEPLSYLTPQARWPLNILIWDSQKKLWK